MDLAVMHLRQNETFLFAVSLDNSLLLCRFLELICLSVLSMQDQNSLEFPG